MIRALRLITKNKKCALLAGALLCFLIAGAQYDSTRPIQKNNSYGIDYNVLRARGVLITPYDTPTVALKDTGAFVIRHGVGFANVDGFWKQITGGISAGGGNAVQISIDSLRLLSNPSAQTVYEVTDVNKEGPFRYDPFDITTPDDSAITITQGSGITKRVYKRIFERVIYPEWWGVPADPSTGANVTGPDAGPGLNKMFRWMERVTRGSYEVRFKNNNYFIGTTVKLPYTLVSLPNDNHPYLLISGNGVTFRTNLGITMIDRMPVTDFDVGTMNDSYKLLIEGLSLVGDRSTNHQNGLNISCMYGGEFKHMQFTGLDTAFIGNFLTKSTISDCFFGVQKRTDIILRSLAGLVGAQTIPGSATNMTLIKNCRFFKETGSYAVIDLKATDNTVIDHNVIEGAQPRYGIASDYMGSTVTNTLIINDLWFEGSSSSPSVNFKIAGAGLTRISNVQRTYPDTLFDFSGSQAACSFLFDGFTYAGGMVAKPFIADASNPNMSGQSIRITNSDPELTTLMFTASSWRNNTVPYNLTSDWYQGANNGYTISNGTNIEYRPSAQLSEGSGYLVMRGNLISKTDNTTNWLGGTPGANWRFKGAYIGDGGVHIDPAGKLVWGHALLAGDLSILRDSISQMRITDNGFNDGNIKFGRGIFSLRTGYSTAIPWDSLGAFDVPAKYAVDSVINQRIHDAVSGISASIETDETLFGTGQPGDQLGADTLNWIGTRWVEQFLSNRMDSIVSHWPTGGGSGAAYSLQNLSTIGDSLFVKVNDSTGRIKKLRNGTNITFNVTDSTVTINGASGSAEINTLALTLSAAGTQAIGADRVITFIMIKPVSDLTSFKAGYVADAESLVNSSAAAGGKWTVFQINEYLDASTTIYFAGITSSTQIKIVYAPIHE